MVAVDRIRDVQRKYKTETGESMEKPGKKLKTFFMILGVTGAVYGVFRFLLPLVAPFVVAWGIASALRPSARRIADWCKVKVRIPKVFGRFFPSFYEKHIEWNDNPVEKMFPEKNERRKAFITLGIPTGVVGVAEVIAILTAAIGAVCYGGRILWLEFAGFLEQLPRWIDRSDLMLTGFCSQMEDGFHLKAGSLVLLVREMLKSLLENIRKSAMPYLMTNSKAIFHIGAEILIFVLLTVISVGMILQEDDHWKVRTAKSIFHKEISRIVSRTALVTTAYLKTQGLLLILISALCSATFFFMGNPYYIMAGIGTGFLDALPIFGTGTILIPWAVILCISRKWLQAAILVALYAACYILREVLESRWMGRQVGLTPFENLMSIFLGLRLFSLPGLFLGPLGILLIRDLVLLWDTHGAEQGNASAPHETQPK
jgi:predicted PurR-regulated permease PerM